METEDPQKIDFAAFVGIDWADQRHDWALKSSIGEVVEHGVVTHTPEAIEAWATELECRFQGRPIAIAMEQSRGALLFALTKYAHFVLYPVHPNTLVNFRRSFRPSGAKSDSSDAGFLLDLLVRHREKLRRLNPDTVETRTLRLLVEGRRSLVNDKTRYSNRLTSSLKMYFPQVLNWFSEVSSKIAGDFLERWPTLVKLQKARPDTLRAFFIDHRSNRSENIERRVEEIRRAIPATVDAAAIASGVAAVTAVIRLLRDLRASIEAYDEQIEKLAHEHPDFAIFDSLPGAGAVLVPRLIAALGTQRDRYNNASELQCYSGIAPVLSSSGKQSWVHWRWACPKFVRQTFHEWAAHSIGSSPWAKSFYDQQRAKGKSRNTAVRALAFKWIRILFRCWKDRTPYREEIYQQARDKRAARTDETVNIQWKSSKGLTKISELIA